jgi:hypothetical protein
LDFGFGAFLKVGSGDEKDEGKNHRKGVVNGICNNERTA